MQKETTRFGAEALLPLKYRCCYSWTPSAGCVLLLHEHPRSQRGSQVTLCQLSSSQCLGTPGPWQVLVGSSSQLVPDTVLPCSS